MINSNSIPSLQNQITETSTIANKCKSSDIICYIDSTIMYDDGNTDSTYFEIPCINSPSNYDIFALMFDTSQSSLSIRAGYSPTEIILKFSATDCFTNYDGYQANHIMNRAMWITFDTVGATVIRIRRARQAAIISTTGVDVTSTAFMGSATAFALYGLRLI